MATSADPAAIVDGASPEAPAEKTAALAKDATGCEFLPKALAERDAVVTVPGEALSEMLVGDSVRLRSAEISGVVDASAAAMEEFSARTRKRIIKPGAHVILRDLEGFQKVFQLTGTKDLRMGRYLPIPIDVVLGVPYGATLRWEDGGWLRTRPCNAVEAEAVAGDVLQNNQHLAQDNSAQVLKPGDISELKKTCSGDAVVSTIIANSSTFAGKTKFSQEKYIKKKQQKHVQQVMVLKPTPMELCETYLNTSRQKISGLRFDYLSSILCHAHVRSGGRFLVVDCAMGLVAGTMVRQLGGCGRVFRVFSGGGCSDKAFNELDLEASERATLRLVPIDVLRCADPYAHDWARPPPELPVASLEADAARTHAHDARAERNRRRREDLAELTEAVCSRGGRNLDGVVIVPGDDDRKLVDEALAVGLARLGAGGRLVVFSQNLQPLAARQGEMKSSSDWVDVRVVQFFTREFQVLPQRTHPHMKDGVNHCEGFLLVGTRVMEADKIMGDEPASKRPRVSNPGVV